MAETYFTGKPCLRGHIGPRYVKGKSCVECMTLKNAEYREANPQKMRRLKQAWIRANPQRERDRMVAWQRANPEWNAANNAKRRAFKMNAPGRGVSRVQWRNCLAESLGVCAYCNERRPLTPDHIEPLSKGGAHDIENVAAACRACNISKNDTPLALWLAWRAG